MSSEQETKDVKEAKEKKATGAVDNGYVWVSIKKNVRKNIYDLILRFSRLSICIIHV